MMREIKPAEVRKNEILDAAAQLFFTKGYERTSTTDILQATGIARGTLYYHFESKEMILNSLIERELSSLLTKAASVAADKKLSVAERMVGTAKCLNSQATHGHDGMLDLLHQPENILLHHRMNSLLLQQAPAIFAVIIEDGIKEGLFQTQYPLETMEMVVLYLTHAFDQTAGLSSEMMLQKMNGFICNFERMLQAQPGSLGFLIELFG